MKKSLCLIFSVCLCFLLLTGCGSTDENGRPRKKDVHRDEIESSEIQFTQPAADAPIAIFDTTMGEIRAVLYPQYAPMAVENFIGLCENGYYNNTDFHRVIYGFAVQGGDASGTGHKGASIWNNQPYPSEFSAQLHHYSGALCAARSPESEVSTTSQFYFVQSLPGALDEALQAQMVQAGLDQPVIDTYNAAGGLPYLDYTDTVFGQVYQGMDIVDQIAQQDTDENDRPVQSITINSVTISTYGN